MGGGVSLASSWVTVTQDCCATYKPHKTLLCNSISSQSKARQQIFSGAQQHKNTSSVNSVQCHMKPYKTVQSFNFSPHVLTYKHRAQCLALEKTVQADERRVLHGPKEGTVSMGKKEEPVK